MNSAGNWKKGLVAMLVVILVLAADQFLKYWIKTSMTIGQEFPVFGDWFILHFTENNGMAFGISFGGIKGKLFLTFFRILAVSAILYYLIYQIKRGISLGLVTLIAFILAGALGNIIDSVFYGVLFTESDFWTTATLAEGNGYAGFFQGKVVDMLYFPLVDTHWPSWVPYFGDKALVFFRPVFNIADAAISVGVFSILIFHRKALAFDD